MWIFVACQQPPRESAPSVDCEPSGTICPWLGSAGVAYFSPDGDFRTETETYLPIDLSFGISGSAYYADFNNQRVREIDAEGFVRTIAGTGMVGDGDLYGEDCWEGCPAGATQWHNPTDALQDPLDPDKIWVASWANDRIAEISLGQQSVRFLAGDGAPYTHDDGPGPLASLYRPARLAAGPDGILYVADQANQVLRRVDRDGEVTTIAGTPGRYGYSGDGHAAEARLHEPVEEERSPGGGMVVDGERLLFADPHNGVIRALNLGTGQIETIVGRYQPQGEIIAYDPRTGEPYETEAASLPGYSGDGGPAEEAVLNEPHDIALGPGGELYIADTGNHCVRVVIDGVISTFAGTCGEMGASGDGGPALEALLTRPYGVTIDPSGGVLVVDTQNHTVRRVAP